MDCSEAMVSRSATGALAGQTKTSELICTRLNPFKSPTLTDALLANRRLMLLVLCPSQRKGTMDSGRVRNSNFKSGTSIHFHFESVRAALRLATATNSRKQKIRPTKRTQRA